MTNQVKALTIQEQNSLYDNHYDTPIPGTPFVVGHLLEAIRIELFRSEKALSDLIKAKEQFDTEVGELIDRLRKEIP